ncbi:MAG: DUF1835 domain-containing protein [Firmicutes bacterium]|nr:DUF1835 domain-containing protein [Bacillota bacterium]
MLEVVFNESACSSLRIAQRYGIGKYHGGAVAVLTYKDDSELTDKEYYEAKKRAEEKARSDWQNAIPLEGDPKDVYCIDIVLSVGEISEDETGFQRRAVLEQLFCVWPTENMEPYINKKLKNAQKSLISVLERCSAGEAVRVWYSNNPDEMCGMYWLMAQLRALKQCGSIYLVKLPDWELSSKNTVIIHSGWGEIGPGEWGRYQSFQQEIQPAFLAFCVAKWRQLKDENAPLRVFLNGQLQSAPEDFYDSFILREIDSQPEIFSETVVIGNVLGKYQLGIGDAWIALRIEKMIAAGNLEIVESTPENKPIYRQKIRKCNIK